MLMLAKESFYLTSEYIKKEARDLEKSLYEYYFEDGSSAKVVAELRKYQNDDGGFGHGLESDIRQPLSSPMVTSIGVRILSEIDDLQEAQGAIKSAVRYLETTFNGKRKGWFVLSKEVNNYPHAPWWHYNEDEGMTIIDKNWGNPSAEIIAYLYKYKEYISKIDVDYLVEHAVKHIETKENFNSDNEIFCYMKLFEVLDGEIKERLRKRIAVSIAQVIEYDKEKWHEYVPMPLDFVPSPDKYRFSIGESKLEENLDFYIELIEKNGVINPPWGKSYYHGEMKPAYDEWKGVLTLKILKRLDDYGRIKK